MEKKHTKMIEELYDGWGFSDEPRGMDGLVQQGVIGHDEPLEKDIELTAVEQFYNEEGFVNTDLIEGKCACNP